MKKPMNAELKNVLQLLAIIVPLFGVAVLGWFYSPMYAEVKASQEEDYQRQRQWALEFIQSTYYHQNYEAEVNREAIIEYYGFTDEGINTGKTFKTHYNQNLRALEQE